MGSTVDVQAHGNEAERAVVEIPRKEITLSWPDPRLQGSEGIGHREGYPINYEDVSNLKGRLLTLIDATFTDPQQRKAQKDCVWQALQAWIHDIERSCGGWPLGPTINND